MFHSSIMFPVTLFFFLWGSAGAHAHFHNQHTGPQHDSFMTRLSSGEGVCPLWWPSLMADRKCDRAWSGEREEAVKNPAITLSISRGMEREIRSKVLEVFRWGDKEKMLCGHFRNAIYIIYEMHKEKKDMTNSKKSCSKMTSSISSQDLHCCYFC